MERVAAIVLAAGASTRLGQRKQLVRLNGETLLARSARVAAEAGCWPVVIVLGFEAESIRASAAVAAGTEIVVNEDWREGMASSIRAGLRALPPACGGAVLLTCDQPAVTAAHLRGLVESSGGEPVASGYAGRRGVPAYFPDASFGGLNALHGDAGARSLLKKAKVLPLERGEVDVDTPEALAGMLAAWERGDGQER